MATKIKPVKCPNCGSGKHIQLDEKRYRCRNCGTEFYLDDDDININVNHHFDYDTRRPKYTAADSFSDNATYRWVLAGILIVGLFLFLLNTCDNAAGSLLSGDKDSVEVHDNYTALVPMLHKGRPCFFYLCERRFDYGYNQKKRKPDGLYYGFRDAGTGEVLADKLFLSKDDDEKRESGFNLYAASIAYFHQAGRWYLVVPKRFIYAIDPDTMSMTNVSKTIFAGKKAMETGMSWVELLDRSSGEGFKVTNNLAETYYFFPATGRLYTEEAFAYASKLPPGELDGEVRDSVCYRLEKVNASSSTFSGGKYRIWRIQYKFHLGDPQDADFLRTDVSRYNYDEGKRLVGFQHVSDWFSAFDAQIVYQDNRYILIAYHPNIDDDATTVFQLRDTRGRIVWTQAPEIRIEVNGAIRGDRQIWIRGTRRYSSKPDEDYCYSLDLRKGAWVCHYLFPTEYKIAE